MHDKKTDFSRKDRQGTRPRPLQSVEIVGRSKIPACCTCDYDITKLKFLLTLLNILSKIKVFKNHIVLSIGVHLYLVYKCTIFQISPYTCTMQSISISILSDNFDSLKCKRGGSLFYGGRYFSWGYVQMTLILRSKNDPRSRRIMTGGHFST